MKEINKSLKKLSSLIEKHPQLESLLTEIEKATNFYKDDEKNNYLRAEMINKQFADKLLTDVERAAYYGLPEGCRMREGAKIISPENLVCGKHVWIGENAILDASGGLEIGEHTSIGQSVYIWTHGSAWANIAYANYAANPFIVRKPTKIGSGVCIGGPATIGYGVTIEDRTIILAFTNVYKSFGKGKCIIGGNPAKIMNEIQDDKIDELMAKAVKVHAEYEKK